MLKNKLVRNVVLPVVSSVVIPAFASNLILPSFSYAQELMRKALILDFEDRSVMTEKTVGLQTQLPDLLSNRLNKTFDILRRSEVSRKLEDYELDESDIEKIQQNFSDLDYIVTGNYGVIGGKDLIINSEVIDLRTEKRASQHVEGSIGDLFELINGVVGEIRSDLGYGVEAKEGKKQIIEERIPTEEEREYEPVSAGLLSRKGQWSLGPVGELSFPMSPEGFKELYNKAITFGFGIKKVTGSKIGFSLPILNFRKFGFDYEAVLREAGVGYGDFDVFEGGTISFLNLGAGITFYPVVDKDLVPFLTVGGGYTHADQKELSITVGGNKTTVMYEDSADGGFVMVTGGLEHLIGENFSLELSGSYERDFVGDGFNFFSLGLGVNLYFGGKK